MLSWWIYVAIEDYCFDIHTTDFIHYDCCIGVKIMTCLLYQLKEYFFVFYLNLQFQIGTIAMRKKVDSSQRILTMLDQLTSQVEKYKVCSNLGFGFL